MWKLREWLNWAIRVQKELEIQQVLMMINDLAKTDPQLLTSHRFPQLMIEIACRGVTLEVETIELAVFVIITLIESVPTICETLREHLVLLVKMLCLFLTRIEDDADDFRNFYLIAREGLPRLVAVWV